MIIKPNVTFVVDDEYLRFHKNLAEEGDLARFLTFTGDVERCLGFALSGIALADEGDEWEVRITPSVDGYEPEDQLNVHGFFITSERMNAGFCSENAFIFINGEGEPELYL